MLLRKSCFIFLISILTVFAQSIDEEESVHIGGSEGSGNAMTDDEDMEGSSLPPDTFYATTPQVRPKFSTSRIQTTTKKSIVSSTTTERIMTSPKMIIESTTTGETRPSMPFGSSTLFGARGIFIVLGAIMLLLVVLIFFVLCYRSRTNKKQTYRPGQRESPDALLKE